MGLHEKLPIIGPASDKTACLSIFPSIECDPVWGLDVDQAAVSLQTQAAERTPV